MVSQYLLYLYRNRGDWCLEDPHYKTLLGEKMRYRQPSGSSTWSPELWYIARWLNEQQLGELRKIDPDQKLHPDQYARLVRAFLQRQP